MAPDIEHFLVWDTSETTRDPPLRAHSGFPICLSKRLLTSKEFLL